MTEQVFYLSLVVVFGAIVGSFLGMCVYRVPRGQDYTFSDDEYDRLGGDLPPPPRFNEPVRSHCPSCGTSLPWWTNVPVVSWFLLRGRCHACGAEVSFRYPLIELLTVLLAALTWHRYGFTTSAFVVFAVCCALVVVTFIDYDYYIIPDAISLPGTALGLVTAVTNEYTSLFPPPVSSGVAEALLGVAAGAGFLYAVAAFYLKVKKKDGLGLGDVKLLAMVGAFFGPACALYTIFIGSLLGSVCGVGLMIARGRSLQHHLPFGPFLAAGTVIYLLVDPGVAPGFVAGE